MVFLVAVTAAALLFKNLPAGWLPTGFTPAAKTVSAADSRNLAEAVRTPQWWMLWGMLFLNVSAGIGLISQRSPMAQDVLKATVSDPAKLAIAGGTIVAISSIFNGLGPLGELAEVDLLASSLRPRQAVAGQGQDLANARVEAAQAADHPLEVVDLALPEVSQVAVAEQVQHAHPGRQRGPHVVGDAQHELEAVVEQPLHCLVATGVLDAYGGQLGGEPEEGGVGLVEALGTRAAAAENRRGKLVRVPLKETGSVATAREPLPPVASRISHLRKVPWW